MVNEPAGCPANDSVDAERRCHPTANHPSVSCLQKRTAAMCFNATYANDCLPHTHTVQYQVFCGSLLGVPQSTAMGSEEWYLVYVFPLR